MHGLIDPELVNQELEEMLEFSIAAYRCGNNTRPMNYGIEAHMYRSVVARRGEASTQFIELINELSLLYLKALVRGRGSLQERFKLYCWFATSPIALPGHQRRAARVFYLGRRGNSKDDAQHMFLP